MLRRAKAQDKWLRCFRDNGGNITMLFALTAPVVIAGAAFGVEIGGWYFDQVRLQQMADVAAYAAAVEERAGSDLNVVTTAATAAAMKNDFDSSRDTLVLNTPPTSGIHQDNHSVEVLLSRHETRYFTGLFDSSPVSVSTRSVATFETAANACVIALDPAAPQSVYVSGSAMLNLVGCNIMANSIASDAIYSQGSSTVSVPCLMTAGDVSLSGPLTETACDAPMTQLAPVADPFKSVPEPADSGACQSSNGKTLQPGRYCNGLSLNSTITLNPGVYIIDGGTLKANGNASITGAGVTFVLASNAQVSFNGNAVLNLSAPTSGPYAGLLFFGSRSNSTSSSVTLNGASSSVMTGAIYFPNQTVSYTGDFAGANGCTQLVARVVQWSGNASLAADCSAYGMASLPVGGVVKIVE
ncbi:pilus assembly protein TadG-related protein [Asticcacaulis sp. EMRT-3]|uniref:TadE/TadG family type IV pilus assembly protein n=1 Tax=Asticcacaulis sp. EMRT-3 TaxID=3040349 RepID=UPI0024AF856F|nr:pilus assembly protein TadG-related protein [Asticcacaulis sp. EMRT-3]MDI7776560.1 pilus assembly protein TadG-related protein [Asticcacaulis sp. EMRT-3]